MAKHFAQDFILLRYYFQSHKETWDFEKDLAKVNFKSWLVSRKYGFNLLTDQGKFAKQYDLTLYVFSKWLKVSEQLKTEKAELTTTIEYPEGTSPGDTNALEEK